MLFCLVITFGILDGRMEADKKNSRKITPLLRSEKHKRKSISRVHPIFMRKRQI